MASVGVDRLAQGQTAAGGGGGGGTTSSKSVTTNLAAGANTVTHNLGTTPTAWVIQDSNGRTLVLTSSPNGVDPDNVLDVTGLKTETNAVVTVFVAS